MFLQSKLQPSPVWRDLLLQLLALLSQYFSPDHAVEFVSLPGLPRRKGTHSLQHTKDVFSNTDFNSDLIWINFWDRILNPMKLIKVIPESSQMRPFEMSTRSLFLYWSCNKIVQVNSITTGPHITQAGHPKWVSAFENWGHMRSG